jgi:hypothetical protein
MYYFGKYIGIIPRKFDNAKVIVHSNIAGWCSRMVR